ncbi:hypothetical protein EAG_16367 [Camponotus floridanus]|uniref:Uncharacterized protein n=1 Tax=Camponotus floridanus TaxID=104421 RepID=E2AZB1_CAMFO|nr:hypothetical protein EAG_16367 [Camponotus floridanus]
MWVWDELEDKLRERKGQEGWGGKRGEGEVAGLENKDKDFWEKLRGWDVIFMSETWLQRKGWERIKKWLPKEYIWEMQEAEKRNIRGRAMGGMIMGRREEIEVEKEEEQGKERGIMTGKMCLGGEWWRLVRVYVNGDLEEKMEKLREWMEDGEEKE